MNKERLIEIINKSYVMDAARDGYMSKHDWRSTEPDTAERDDVEELADQILTELRKEIEGIKEEVLGASRDGAVGKGIYQFQAGR
jgi:hypothetical protein